MKKILCTVLIIVLILTACSTKKVTESTTTLKTFAEVYTNDIEVAIDYFNTNFDGFSSNELKCDFYSNILSELTIIQEKLIIPTSKDSTTRYYNFVTNEFNINYFDDNEDYKNIQSNKYFTLALNNDTFSVIVSETLYGKLKDGLNYYIQNKRDKELPDNYPYIPKFIPVFEFENENVDFNTGMSNYNTVLVHNPTELSKLKDMNGLLPVNFVEHDIITKDDAFYYQDDLVKGVIVSDNFTVDTFEYSTDGYTTSYSFKLDCNKYVAATLIYNDNNNFKFHEININEPIFDKPIMVNNPLTDNGLEQIDLMLTGGTFGIDVSQTKIEEELIDFVTKDTSKSLNGTVYIKSLTFSENEMESNWTLDITDFKPSESELKRTTNLSRFKNETLYSVDEKLDINYSKYNLVIIPAQTSINEDELTKRTVKLADVDNSFPLKFAVLGEIKKLEFETYENVLNEEEVPKTLVIDETIKDTLVNVVSYLPTDFSVVSVTVTLLDDTTTSFSLDDLRDPESHSIILIK